MNTHQGNDGPSDDADDPQVATDEAKPKSTIDASTAREIAESDDTPG